MQLLRPKKTYLLLALNVLFIDSIMKVCGLILILKSSYANAYSLDILTKISNVHKMSEFFFALNSCYDGENMTNGYKESAKEFPKMLVLLLLCSKCHGFPNSTPNVWKSLKYEKG